MFQRQDSCGQMNRTIMQFKNSNFPVIWKKVKWREDKLKLRPSLNQGLFFGEYDHIKFPSGIPKKKWIRYYRRARGSHLDHLASCDHFAVFYWIFFFPFEIFSKVQTDHFLFFGFAAERVFLVISSSFFHTSSDFWRCSLAFNDSQRTIVALALPSSLNSSVSVRK